jgi:hypothetical protein
LREKFLRRGIRKGKGRKRGKMGNKNMCKREDNKGKQSTVCEEILSYRCIMERGKLSFIERNWENIVFGPKYTVDLTPNQHISS